MSGQQAADGPWRRSLVSGPTDPARRHRTRRARRRRPPARTVVAVLAVATLAGCSGAAGTGADDEAGDPLRVVTTTPILADIASAVAGDRATVTSIVPANADPHSYEPSLRDIRDVAYADVAFSNYLLLEQQSIIKTFDANLPEGAVNVSLAEAATKYAAEVIPLVENVNLDTIWLVRSRYSTGTGAGW